MTTTENRRRAHHHHHARPPDHPALLSAVALFAIDPLSPGLPTMVDDLHTTPTGVQLTLTAFLLGLAIGNSCWAPSDRFWSHRTAGHGP